MCRLKALITDNISCGIKIMFEGEYTTCNVVIDVIINIFYNNLNMTLCDKNVVFYIILIVNVQLEGHVKQLDLGNIHKM